VIEQKNLKPDPFKANEWQNTGVNKKTTFQSIIGCYETRHLYEEANTWPISKKVEKEFNILDGWSLNSKDWFYL
jgi:hypothetical protein